MKTCESLEVISQKLQTQLAIMGGSHNILKWATSDDVILGDFCGYKQAGNLKSKRSVHADKAVNNKCHPRTS